MLTTRQRRIGAFKRSWPAVRSAAASDEDRANRLEYRSAVVIVPETKVDAGCRDGFRFNRIGSDHFFFIVWVSSALTVTSHNPRTYFAATAGPLSTIWKFVIGPD